MRLDFRVPGRAVPWSIKLNRRTGSIYPSERVREWQQTVADHARAAIYGEDENSETEGQFPVAPDVPIALEVICYRKRPTGKRAALHYDVRKPDATNIQKAVEDALRGIVYPDDAQVVSPACHKRFCGKGSAEHVQVRVWSAGDRPGKWGL